MVKPNRINGQDVWDVIIVDTKLSSTTNLTDNQAVAQGRSGFILKSRVNEPNNLVYGSMIDLNVKPIIKTLTSFVIIYSNGNGGYGGVK
ncbi:MAG: hypothetical protein U0U66_13690 [Cytophagaceae bacterium]